MAKAMASVSLSAPVEIYDLAIGFVATIYAMEFEYHPLWREVRVDPPGRISFAEDVGDGRQIDQINAAGVALDFPGMSVPENVGLHLRAGPNDFEERAGVYQADVSLNAGVV